MKKEDLQPAHECVIFGVRDQTLPSRSIRRKIWNEDVPLTCSVCGQAEETIGRIISACPELGFTEHLSRHNSVAKVILRAIMRANGKEFTSRWWHERPDALIKLSNARDHYVQWEPKFPTVQSLKHTKPDLYLSLPNGKRVIIEVTVCNDDRACLRADEKLSKYLPLREQIGKQERNIPHVLPIAIGTTGVVSKVTENAVKKLNDWGIPLRLSKLQKAAAIGTAMTIKRVLN